MEGLYEFQLCAGKYLVEDTLSDDVLNSKDSEKDVFKLEQSDAHVLATSERILAQLAYIRKKQNPLSSDADSTDFQRQQKETLRGYFSMSLEAIQQGNCFAKMEGILHELVQHTDDLQEKTIFEDIISRLLEFQAMINDAEEMSVAAEAQRSAHAGKAADLYSKIQKRQKEISSLEFEFSSLPDEDAQKKLISDKLERAKEENCRETEEYWSWEAKKEHVYAELFDAKVKLESANVRWELGLV